MAQYRSHTPDTIAYMEDYLDQIHRMTDIFLNFQGTKLIQAKFVKQGKEIRRKRSLMREGEAPSPLRQICHDNCDKENKLHTDMIDTESYFNFPKMHLLSHFCDNIQQFGNILKYSTEI